MSRFRSPTAALNRGVVVLAVVALVGVAASRDIGAGSAPTHVPANVRVSSGRFSESGEPALAVNPRNPQDLFGATQDINAHPGPAPGTFVSDDGGTSWSDNGLLPLPAGDRVGGDVTVAFDRAGTGFVLSHAGPGGFNVNRLLLWRTNDGGHHFGKPTLVFNGHSVVLDHPSLAVDTSRGPHEGTVYAAWTAGPPARFPIGSRLYFSRSTDGGKTFSRARTIAGLPGQFPAVPVASVDGSGGLHILFTAGHGDPYHPPFRPFTRVILSSNDGGVRFASPQRITEEPVFLPLRGITTANIGTIAAAKRALYVAVAGSHGNATHILIWRSLDQGRSWHGPVAISPTTSAASQCFQPQLAITAAGTVYLSYLAIKSHRVNVYLTHSTKHGATFTTSQRISGSSFNPRVGDTTRSPALPWIGDYQALAAGPHAIHATWTDTRTGKMQLFAASIRVR